MANAEFDWTGVFAAVVVFVTALITGVLLPWLRGKLGEEKFQRAMEWASVAAQAAEQIYRGPGRGEEKLAYALDFLQSRGITFDKETLRAMVETAVARLGKELLSEPGS